MHIELTAAEFREVFGCNPVIFKAAWTKEIHDDCEGCKYWNKGENEYPCSECKHSYMDMYVRVGD